MFIAPHVSLIVRCSCECQARLFFHSSSVLNKTVRYGVGMFKKSSGTMPNFKGKRLNLPDKCSFFVIVFVLLFYIFIRCVTAVILFWHQIQESCFYHLLNKSCLSCYTCLYFNVAFLFTKNRMVFRPLASFVILANGIIDRTTLRSLNALSACLARKY